MKKIFLKIRSILSALLVLAASAAGLSCSTEGNIQQILGTTVQAPVFLDCRAISPTDIVFTFSTPVDVVSFHSDTALEADSVSRGEEVVVSFKEPLDAGVKIIADLVVEDSGRNSLNVIVPFRARNDRIPALVFNELRTEYAKPRVEFVEFYTPEAGNLGALRLFIAGHSLTKPVYEFAPMEVKAGEYIVLHLRSIDEGCIDETGNDLSLSFAPDAHNSARDLWISGSVKMLRKTDALWLLDQDDRIIDAVLLCENPAAGWGSNKNIPPAVEYLSRLGAWLPNPADAVATGAATATRTVSRDEDIAPERLRENWYITATSSATPGAKNSTKRYAQ